MTRTPRSKEVLTSIKNVARETKLAIKEVNQLASAKLVKGNYSAAQALIELAQKIDEFQTEVKTLEQSWRAVRSTATTGAGNNSLDQIKLWEYYKPILKCLVDLGGEGTKKQIIAQFESDHSSILKEGDFVKSSRGTPKWQRMIAKARKPMREEEFVESTNLLTWKITAKGKRAAKV